MKCVYHILRYIEWNIDRGGTVGHTDVIFWTFYAGFWNMNMRFEK